MTFTLRVDGPRWRANVDNVTAEVRSAIKTPSKGEPTTDAQGSGDIVPVAKGNGYGLGVANLAREAERIGVSRMAVGTPYEAAAAGRFFSGQILVMQPWDARDVVAEAMWDYIDSGQAGEGLRNRIIRTVASVEALHELATGVVNTHDEAPKVVIEGLTSMRRFGLAEPDLDALLADNVIRQALRERRIELYGLALHLPIAQPKAPHVETLESNWHDDSPIIQPEKGASARVREAWSWSLTWLRAVGQLEDAGCQLTSDAVAMWVSHLDDQELKQLRRALPNIPVFVRMGTRLWLGDAESLSAKGTILAVHETSKGRAVGYRQRGVPKAGLLIVVGGGTSHGVALEAPTPAASLRQRAVSVGTGALESLGRARSPFVWGGKHRWFVEPPHMQVSLIWVAEEDVRATVGQGGRVPQVGDELECRVRHTTAAFDQIIGLD
ncbi:MAG: alanine racemase [Candidatus Nanopelagicales bacterium]